MIVIFLMVFIGGCTPDKENVHKEYFKSDNVRILKMNSMEGFNENHITRIEYDNEVCFLSQGWNNHGITQSLSCIKK